MLILVQHDWWTQKIAFYDAENTLFLFYANTIFWWHQWQQGVLARMLAM